MNTVSKEALTLEDIQKNDCYPFKTIAKQILKNEDDYPKYVHDRCYDL